MKQIYGDRFDTEKYDQSFKNNRGTMRTRPQYPSAFDHLHFGTPKHSIITGARDIATATLHNKTIYCTWGRNLTLQQAQILEENEEVQIVCVGLIHDDTIGGPRHAYEVVVDPEILPDLQLSGPDPSLGGIESN